MKTELEIYKAHDLLVMLITKQAPVVIPPEAEKGLIAAADVLCWVLEHKHNETFGNNLKSIEALFNECGLEITRIPHIPHASA